jgi:hypothetical protein
MGRAATLNGNGRAVLPPSVLDPMRRYRQPPPPTRSTGRLIGKVFGWIVLALLVVGSGLAGGLPLWARDAECARAALSAGEEAQKDLASVPPPSRPATALVVGYDQRAGADGFTAKDSLRHADAHPGRSAAGHALGALVSRDLIVPISLPCHVSVHH